MPRPIRTLLFSTLYPSSVRPSHGIFVETRLREILKTGRVESVVVAPVPWFPFTAERFGEYAQFAQTPRHEMRNGISVHHPRYWLLPKVGMNLAPAALARAALPVIRNIQAQGFDFDLIDAHYYYPDGVAAAQIARELGKPFLVTARGTDLNLIPQFPLPRQKILQTAEAASASVGVCSALMEALADLGAKREKLHVLRNGVDLERFRPEPRAAARHRIGYSGPQGDVSTHPLWLSVGHLIERKGHHLAIEALELVPQARLIIVGRGEEENNLKALAQRLKVANRVRFAGAVANADLRWYYSAADALLLCSSREGWANVLLESMACGTPVVATNIWGTPEVVASPEAGVLMRERSAQGLVQAWLAMLRQLPSNEATRAHAEKFGWGQTVHGCIELFEAIGACHFGESSASDSWQLGVVR